jgi:hypothetical protein
VAHRRTHKPFREAVGGGTAAAQPLGRRAAAEQLCREAYTAQASSLQQRLPFCVVYRYEGGAASTTNMK